MGVWCGAVRACGRLSAQVPAGGGAQKWGVSIRGQKVGWDGGVGLGRKWCRSRYSRSRRRGGPGPPLRAKGRERC
ncbi:hypothetical protein Pmani_035238 [Petrolisthes manimaculis]|uniref:Uncharacterized protein n=1 Tax=Petrolisthes manimaculis TaxID=1843537 RepID=A0AAE1TQN4_9EUCA|nr:hypothetical protein Pmani_035238 [Petrolisthes manimaculis]